jgi:Trypsin-like peptidase domain/Divergent InlB B-repeat domain
MRRIILITFAFLLAGCGNQPFSSTQSLDTGRANPADRDVFLLVTTVGSGEVSPPGGRIETGTVELSALSADGWVFDRWEGDALGTDNPLELELDEDMSVTAVFTQEVVEPIATVEDVLDATWLIAGVNDEVALTATAFGIGPKRLATNAHVTEGLKELFQRPGAVAQAIHHETGETRDILRVWTHPAYDAESAINTADLGLIEIEGSATKTLAVANEADVRELSVFDAVSLCGFPADVLGAIDLVGSSAASFRPRATCLTGNISALRPLDPASVATPFSTQLIQYDLPTAPGTSGSALFGESGAVVGVHFAGVTGSGSGFAIRADRLTELMNIVDRNRLEGTPLSSIEPIAPISPGVSGLPCSRTYFSDPFGFGFNLPPGWTGPIVRTLSTGILLDHEFSGPGVGGIFASVWTSFSADPSFWISLKLDLGSVLLEDEIFLTESGHLGYYLVFREPNGWLYYESHIYTDGREYKLFSPIFPWNPPSLVSAVEASLKSLCVRGGRARRVTVSDDEMNIQEQLQRMEEAARMNTEVARKRAR